jgi:hypothetical protein
MDTDTAVRLLRSAQIIAYTLSCGSPQHRKSSATPSPIPSRSTSCTVRRKWTHTQARMSIGPYVDRRRRQTDERVYRRSQGGRA